MTAGALASEIRYAVSAERKSWWTIVLAVPVIYLIGMMIALMVRFENFPNYVTFYDYFGNVAEIIRATPSVRDMVPIIAEEWLIEIGYMNSDWGAPISEWSLNVIPSKVVVVIFLGMLIATCIALLRAPGPACPAGVKRSANVATGIGATMAGVTSLTMSWVVCCATPSWVVGLAMLGVGVSTSLWLEFLGPWLSGAGFILMALCAIALAWRRVRGREAAVPPASLEVIPAR